MAAPGSRFRSLAEGRPLRSRRILVTTGLRDELPDIPGVGERWGRDLLHCPYCHGHEVRDQPLGVLWWGSGRRPRTERLRRHLRLPAGEGTRPHQRRIHDRRVRRGRAQGRHAFCRFARAYADQTERDHATLVSAVRNGTLPAETGI
jgi:hypothetical protein